VTRVFSGSISPLAALLLLSPGWLSVVSLSVALSFFASLSVALSSFAPLSAASSSDAQTAVAESESYNLAFLDAERPVFLQIQITVDGKGLGSLRRDFAAQVFRRLDKDQDGRLNAEELTGLDSAIRVVAPLITPDAMMASVDRSKDGDVTLDEFFDFIDARMGPRFSVLAAPRPSAQAVDLFALLDENRDGRIARSELTVGYETLIKLDRNEDETLSIEELEPFRDPAMVFALGARPTQQRDVSFVSLGLADQAENAVAELQRRYSGTRRTASPSQETANGIDPHATVGRDALGLTPEQFAPYDPDHNGTLDASELRAFVLKPPVQVELRVQLPFKTRKPPQMELVRHDLASNVAGSKGVEQSTGETSLAKSGRRNRSAAPPPETRLDLPIGGVNFSVRTSRSTYTDLADNRSQFKIQFLQSDVDKNKYLDANEFPRLGLGGVDFQTVDLNGDGMVTIDEVVAFVDQEAAAAQCKAILYVGNDGRSLFQLLDGDSDNRLSLREFVRGSQVVDQYDRDQRGALVATDLVGRYSLRFALGRTRTFEGGNTNPAAMQMNTDARITETREGPKWFQKMDRNRDRDISRREFLGPIELFSRIDADSDGLISVTEAAEYDAATRTAVAQTKKTDTPPSGSGSVSPTADANPAEPKPAEPKPAE
jgi:Ca2+-binding EF-hand superfamily protein